MYIRIIFEILYVRKSLNITLARISPETMVLVPELLRCSFAQAGQDHLMAVQVDLMACYFVNKTFVD